MGGVVLRLEPTEVFVALPRFEIDYTADLIPSLQALDIQEIFGPRANLSGIVFEANAQISNVFHKAKIQVDEQGTTASAATGAVVIPLMGTTTPRFRADHPFIFFIRHTESGNILFEGRLNEPVRAQAYKQTSRASQQEQKFGAENTYRERIPEQAQSQYPLTNRYSGNNHYSENNQYPGSSQNSQNNQYPENSQYPESRQYPGNSQYYNSQYVEPINYPYQQPVPADEDRIRFTHKV